LRIKNVGHINSDSALGVWQQGIHELQGLLRKRIKAQHHLLFVGKKIAPRNKTGAIFSFTNR
jgi:hypothetical protein